MQRSPESNPLPRRVRVLIVTDEMEVGGSQRQIVNLVLGMDSARFDVSVAYFRNRSFFVDQLERSGIRVVHIPKRGRLDARFLAALRRELRTGGHDVVHAFGFTAEIWTAVARLALPPSRRPQLFTSIRGTYDWYGALQWRLKRWVTGQSGRVVANSRMGADFARQRMQLPEHRIEVVYNGVAAEAAVPGGRERLRAQLALPESALAVLFAGRLVDVKDVPTLLRAVRRLALAGSGCRAVICGEGDQGPQLKRLCDDLGLAAVVNFVGQRDDVATLIEACDVVVLTSRQEGLSNAILEAMRGSRCVVATRAGGNVELVEPEVNGLLFDVGDDQALAEALRRLESDPALRERLGQAGAERVRRLFGVPAMVKRFEQLYGEADRQSRAHA